MRTARTLCKIAVLAAAFLAAASFACVKSNPPASAQATLSPAPVASVATASPVPTPSPAPTPDPAMAPYTVAWISDTQGYCAAIPETFDKMVEWIVDHREERNIQYVVHTGDVVNEPLNDLQWQRASHALLPLKGVLPLFAVAGNHDIGGVVRNYKHFNALMEELGVSSLPTFGGMEADYRRRYDLVTIGREDFIFIGCGYASGRADVDWINGLLEAHRDRTAILILHWYLDHDGELKHEGLNLYKNVVVPNDNVKLVLCGHRHDVLHVEQPIDRDKDGIAERTVTACMGDYQGYEGGGGGYICLITFDPVAREIRFASYSPLLDDWNYFDDESVETFTVPY